MFPVIIIKFSRGSVDTSRKKTIGLRLLCALLIGSSLIPNTGNFRI